MSVVSALFGLHAPSFKERNPVAACRCGKWKEFHGVYPLVFKPLLVLCPTGPQSILGHSLTLQLLSGVWCVTQQSKKGVYSTGHHWRPSPPDDGLLRATTVPVVDPGELDH